MISIVDAQLKLLLVDGKICNFIKKINILFIINLIGGLKFFFRIKTLEKFIMYGKNSKMKFKTSDLKIP